MQKTDLTARDDGRITCRNWLGSNLVAPEATNAHLDNLVNAPGKQPQSPDQNWLAANLDSSVDPVAPPTQAGALDKLINLDLNDEKEAK